MWEPLVLLPAMMCDSRIFAAQIEALSRERPVMVAPLGTADRVEEMAAQIVEALPPRCALFGLGLGGNVAIEILRRAPERVTRICLAGTSPLAETPEIASAREVRIVAARAGRLDEALAGEFPMACYGSGPGQGAVLELVADMARVTGPESFVSQSRAMQRRPDQQAALRRLRQPALVLCGAQDAQHPVRRQEVLARLIPFARLNVIEAAGRLLPVEAPDAVTQAIRGWLRQPLVLR